MLLQEYKYDYVTCLPQFPLVTAVDTALVVIEALKRKIFDKIVHGVALLLWIGLNWMICFNPLKGAPCQVNFDGLTSIEDVRHAICINQNIEKRHLMLLVAPTGQQLKELNSSRIFVYDKSWAQKASANDSALESQVGDINLCIEGANLAILSLNHNIASISKQLAKAQLYQSQIHDDIVACDGWPRYYDVLHHITGPQTKLKDVFDKNVLEKCYRELSESWPQISARLESLKAEHDSLKSAEVPSFLNSEDFDLLKKAQNAFLSTLKRLGHSQSKWKEKLHRPLTALCDDLKHAENLKSQVAQIIDTPFLYGVLLIESARRQKWHKDFEPIWKRESQRQADWSKHYGSGSVGSVVERLDKASGLNILEVEANCPFPASLQESEMTVDSYLQILEAFNIEDVARDLKAELGAMRRQLARSMSASISSLIPTPLTTPSPLTGPNHSHSLSPSTSLIAAYESRIRKLETILLQSRMSSKAHELDFIRAETRAEARAEARAEVKAEQQEARIRALESEKADLIDRLQLYMSGLETVLNSMGLQTFRVDPETGSAGVYQVNRVKGLSRRMAPKSGESNTGSEGSEDDSNSVINSKAEVAKAQSSKHLRSIPIDRLLEQTSIDSDVLYEAATKRFGDVERLARKLQIENRRFREKDTRMERDLRQRLALHSFRPDDLILFLPTRDTQCKPNPWAAFNAGAPHYFLHPTHADQLENREYLIARASKVEKHVAADDEDNIFQLPAGVEWFLVCIHGEWGA